MKWRAISRGERETVPATYEQTVLPHLDAAYNLARWLVRDPTLADDVLQDATLRALAHFETYRGGDGRAWLLRIVRNTAYDTIARQRRNPATSLDQPGCEPHLTDPSRNPEQALAANEDRRTLEGALAALPPELRECLLLRELEELSYKQVAVITGVPIGTVMSRLWRARQALTAAQPAKGAP